MKLAQDRYGQAGSVSSIAAIIILVIALICVSAFAVWANNGRNDYKNNVDQKIQAAVNAAKDSQQAVLQKQFDEQAKLPTLSFSGPEAYGSVTFNYPRTWDGYIDESDSSNPLQSLFYKGPVPSQGVFYALRVDLVNDDYKSVLQQMDQFLQQGQVKASAYIPPKMKGKPNSQTGTRFDGAIEQGNSDQPIQGSMVILKVRDKTLKVYTESPAYISDFNKIVLASLTYNP